MHYMKIIGCRKAKNFGKPFHRPEHPSHFNRFAARCHSDRPKWNHPLFVPVRNLFHLPNQQPNVPTSVSAATVARIGGFAKTSRFERSNRVVLRSLFHQTN
ncbi:hypothetical protein CEXT_549761 [Caerostris extrusa]|uniref:Uncharacterized protein n=1 Tax=Caerostris extrusa TaxID=172846 RepID=A0AAV4X0M1_CAEEX|nr:hypothetical protein CEXT_549761 [Caerostris extrusa]